MSAVVETDGVGKRYRRRWALRDCTLTLPAARIVGLVGLNGAGKTTLLHLLVGLVDATTGSIRVFGEPPAARPELLARVGFVAQSSPLYPSLSVGEHLAFGRHMNPRWDEAGSAERLGRLGLDPTQRAGQLSGGQRAQLALTLALGKRPELLILDEPVASLDPLARREFLQTLMEAVAEQEMTIVLSSHLLGDLERVCDHVVVLSAGQVRLAGDVDDLLGAHRLLSGPRKDPARLPGNQTVVTAEHTDRQSTLLVETTAPILDPAWSVAEVSLEDLVLAYMAADRAAANGRTGGDLAAVRS